MWRASGLEAFRREVWDFYAAKGRHFPWRETSDPYAILVSEFMLQQTQVQRVLTAYPAFLQRFPSLETVAAASLEEVLKQWGRLGYSRRALNLQRAARQVMAERQGCLPRNADELETLPGVGPATAAAVAAFAFGQATVLLETNIRSALIHHFFSGAGAVGDAELRPLAAALVDGDNPRHWYYALMDLGAFLKRVDRGLTRRASVYRVQPAYAGSRRALRAAVVREVLQGRGAVAQMEALRGDEGGYAPATLGEVLAELEREGFLRLEHGVYRIA